MAATTGYSHKSSYYKTRTINNNYVEHVSNYNSTVVQSANCHYKYMIPPSVVHGVVYYDQVLMPANCNKVLAAEQIRTRTFHHSPHPKGDQTSKMTTITSATPNHTTTELEKLLELTKDAGKADNEKYKRSRVINHREAAEMYGGRVWETNY